MRLKAIQEKKNAGTVLAKNFEMWEKKEITKIEHNTQPQPTKKIYTSATTFSILGQQCKNT